MVFGKLFGRSAKRPPAQVAIQRPAVKPFDPKKVVAPDFELVDKPGQPQSQAAEQGFDPYNTGSFDKRNTWKRIPRL